MPSREASWHHGSSVSVIFTPMRLRRSSRPRSVIFGNSVAFSGDMRLRLAQRLAIHLAGRRPRQRGDERHAPRILVLAESRARELLQLARECVVAAARTHDERLDDLTPKPVG